MRMVDWSSVRSIPPKTKGNRGFFPSNKVSSGIVNYESQLERDFFLILEHSPSVKRFQHQPVIITYRDTTEKIHNYVPDAFVEFFIGSRVLVEIKNKEEVENQYEKYKERWKAAEEWAEEKRTLFAVLTEDEIRTARLSNIWFTLGASKVPTNDKYVLKLDDLLTVQGKHFNDLCLILAENLGVEVGKASQIVCYAIYHGLVFVDTFSTGVISAKTIIRKKQNPKMSPFRPLCEELNWTREWGDQKKESHDVTSDVMLKTLSQGSIPEKYVDVVEQRLKVVKAWLKQPSVKRTTQWRTDFCQKWSVKQQTVYRWVKAYKENSVEGLIPRHRNKGKISPFDQQTLQVLEEARKTYLKPTITMKIAYRNLTKECERRNLPLPSFSAFRYFIYKTTNPSELAYRKRGQKFHKSHFSPSLASFQGAIMPMQVLQIDNTILDVFPVDSTEREVLGPPPFTAAIDCYTRMVTGFYLSYSSCSSLSILETLVQSILPKKSYTQTYETEYDWPIQGFPVLILVDNGMDYRSKSVREFCLKYDIILEFAPLRTPRYKAYIEQWFNVLRQAILDEGILGYRPLLKQRLENPDLKPEIDAVLTLQELETWLLQWIVDRYHLTNPYNDHVPAPFLRWFDAVQGTTDLYLPLPRDPPSDPWVIEQLYLKTLDRFERVLTRNGVQWEYLVYNSRELAAIYNEIGIGDKVTVLLDRRDVRRVWIISPVDEKPLQVGLATGWAKILLEVHGNRPINASGWKNAVRAVQKRFRERITPYAYKMDYSRIKRAKLIETSVKKTKRKRREVEKSVENERKRLSARLPVYHELEGEKDPFSYQTLGTRDREEKEEEGKVPRYPTEWSEAKKSMKLSWQEPDEDDSNEEEREEEKE